MENKNKLTTRVTKDEFSINGLVEENMLLWTEINHSGVKKSEAHNTYPRHHR